MDCRFNGTLNLCSEPECLDSVVTVERRPGLGAPHGPNHDMLKVHSILFDRNMPFKERCAKYRLETAWNMISALEAEKKPMPKCLCCHNVVSLPCWCCIDCYGEFLRSYTKISPCSSELFCVEEEEFICVDCEHKCLAFNDTHTRKHTIVRVFQKVETTVVSTEERLKVVEEQLGAVNGELGLVKGELVSVKGELGSVKGQLGSVQEELSKVTRLLSKLFEKDAEGTLGDPR